MKRESLKVGIDSRPFKYEVEVEIDVAETVEDCMKLARGSEAYVAQCFMRGHRVKLQDSEARSALRAYLIKHNIKSAAEITRDIATTLHKIVTDAIASFDPTKQRERSSGRKSVQLERKLFEGLNAKQRSALLAQFEAQNVTVELI